jgi:hypothetical protein
VEGCESSIGEMWRKRNREVGRYLWKIEIIEGEF